MLTTQSPIITTHPPSVVPALIQPIVELTTATIPAQLSQLPAPVSLSLLSQEHSANNFDQHRYPTRFSVSQQTYSMARTRKYSYAAAHLEKNPAPPVHFHEHMACPVINPHTGVSLEYRHLIQGPDRDIWVKSLANDFGHLAQGVETRMPTVNSTIFSYTQVKSQHTIKSPMFDLL